MRGVTPSLDLRGHFCAGRADDQGEQTRSAAVVLTIGSFTGEHCDVR
jgi:hypothetical protein